VGPGSKPVTSPVAIVRTIAGPWGPLHLAATEGGIAAAESATAGDAFISEVAKRLRGSVVAAAETASGDPRHRMLDRAEAVSDDRVAGRPPGDRVPVDLADRPAWDRLVLGAVRDVGWGETASYGEIAHRIGSPRAARAVGGALGRNPVTLLVPCHRVIAADGTIGGYGADAWGSRDAASERKRELLRREGVTVVEQDR
jgi:methylated-DNA-[protein]-cysteine S-methyltransferase